MHPAGACLFDDLQLVKLYPEGNAGARFKIRGVRRIVFIAIVTVCFLSMRKRLEKHESDMIHVVIEAEGIRHAGN